MSNVENHVTNHELHTLIHFESADLSNTLIDLISSCKLEGVSEPDAYLWSDSEPKSNVLCHKLVLAAASPVLNQILSDQCPCSDAHVILCPGMSYEELSWIKNYIYTGQVVIDSKKVPEFLSCVQTLGLATPTSEVLFSVGIADLDLAEKDRISQSTENREQKNDEGRQHELEENGEQESAPVEMDTSEYIPTPSKSVCSDSPEPRAIRRSSRIRKPSRAYETIKAELLKRQEDFTDVSVKEEDEHEERDGSGDESSDVSPTSIYTCSFCQESFSNPKLFSQHKKSHSAERPYHCSDCDKTFRYPSELNSHMRTHTGEKPFLCEICKRTFAHRSTLAEHMNIHSNEKAYNCNVCLRGFSQRKGLRAHRCEGRQEDGDRFQCEYCGRNFTNRKAIALHRIHHEQREPTEKSFLCDICGRGFQNKYILQTHQITHTDQRNFVCETCGKTFAQKKHLQAHQYVHSSAGRPYQCSQCDKSFRYVANLEIHERVHTGQKPYVCHLCQEAFRQKCALKEHLGTHSGLDCTTCGKSFATNKKLTKHLYSHSMATWECSICHERFNSTAKLEAHTATHIEPTAAGKGPNESIITLEVVPDSVASDGELVLSQSMMHIMETPATVTGDEPWTFEVVIPGGELNHSES